MRFLLLLGVAAPILRHILIYGLGWLTPNYSASRDFLSELSAIGAPYSWIMNVFGLALIGVMMVLAAFALHRGLAALRGGRLAAWLIGISGIGFVCIALFPCDPGCVAVEPSFRMTAHLVAGVTAMGAETSSALMVGVAMIAQRKLSGFVALALILGTVGLGALVLLVSGVGDLPAGLVQRVVQGAGDAWLLSASLFCLHQSRDSRGNP